MSACDQLKELGYKVDACEDPHLTNAEAGQIVPVLAHQGYNQPTNFHPRSVVPHDLMFWINYLVILVLVVLAGWLIRKYWPIVGSRIASLLVMRRERLREQRDVSANNVFPFEVENIQSEVSAIDAVPYVRETTIQIPDREPSYIQIV